MTKYLLVKMKRLGEDTENVSRRNTNYKKETKILWGAWVA